MRVEDVAIESDMVEMGLKGADLLIYATVRAYEGDSGLRASYRELSSLWGLSEAAVVRSVRRLEGRGVLWHVRNTVRRGADAANIYRTVI